MSKLKSILFITSLMVSGSGFSFSAWDSKNNPDKFEWDYEMVYSKLPKSGKLSEMPWSGDYWPTYKGGITYRWNNTDAQGDKKFSYKIPKNFNDIKAEDIKKMSPAEKYDLYLGRSEFPLTNYERNRTNIMKTIEGSETYEKDFKIPTWEGLCHAWAPATILYSNPKPVTMIGKKGHAIEFGSSDLKALLTYHLHLAKAPRTRFLGSRCNIDFGKIYQDLQNNALYGKDVTVLIEKLKEHKKELTETLKLDNEESLSFSWDKKKALLDIFNKLSNDKEDIDKLNILLKKDDLESEGKVFIKGMIDKKITMAIELEGKMNRSECKDTNAGSFHVVITNQISKMDEGFVVDVTRDSEVWNQAVQGFDVKEIEEKGPSEGSAEGTVKEVIVETKMHYIVEIEQAWNKIAPSNQIATKTYRYKLELDKDGKILGGEWISLDRPDFIWKNGRSEFKGLFEDLGKIYKKSVAYKKTETTDAMKNLEDRIKKFEEEKKNVEEKLKADSKKLAEEKEELEEQKNLIKVEKEKINKELLDEKKKLNDKISSNKEKLQIELDKLDAQIKSNAETFAIEIKKIEEQKETISVKASQLEADRKAFEESKKKMALEMKSLKKAQKELDDKKKKFQAEKEAQVKKMANQRSKMTLLRKKLGETSAKLRKEKAKLAQEIKKFEGQKNQGIIKDLIKDLRPQLEKQRKAVSVALVILTNAKKKSSATLKAYKVLRGGLFNRNFKRLKKLYKSAMMDQKVKQTALDGEKAKLKNLKIELRDAVNRLRVLSVS
jgi:hypothetical protein